MELKIGIIGAGIVGLTSAVNIQKLLPNVKVTIMAEKFLEESTSNGAGGIFRPTNRTFPGTDVEDVR